jgi:hypothetical protein
MNEIDSSINFGLVFSMTHLICELCTQYPFPDLQSKYNTITSSTKLINYYLGSLNIHINHVRAQLI